MSDPTNKDAASSDGDADESLGADLGWSKEDLDGYRAKGGAFRGLTHAIGEAGLRERVLAGLPSASRAIYDKPPLSVAWMPGVHFQYVLRALDEIGGEELVRKMGLSSMLHGPVNFMRPLIEGTLRLFGATPHAFFARVPSIMAGQVDGMTFEYGKEGPERAMITVRFDELRDLPPRTWWYWEGAFSSTFELCKVEGSCRAKPTDSPRRNEAKITATWSSQ